MAVCVQSRTACVSFTSSSSVFHHSPKQKKKKTKKKKSFLSLMADSHKFVLNMSSIDPSCQMKTIKEMALSAAHLGAKMEGLKEEGCGRETGMKSEGVREDVCV